MESLQLYPAILTADLKIFNDRLNAYLENDFKGIDFDVADNKFLDYDTVGLAEVLKTILEVSQQHKDLPVNYFGLDLAVSGAEVAIDQILKFSAENKISLRIYLDAKSAPSAISKLAQQSGVYKGLVLQSDFRVKDLAKLGTFDEIQFMGIKKRRQHEPFWEGVLDKVVELRDSGFSGVISIDGGVNLQTAPFLNQYIVHSYINRLSVGSYFQDAKDVKLNKQKLELALAMHPQPLPESESE